MTFGRNPRIFDQHLKQFQFDALLAMANVSPLRLLQGSEIRLLTIAPELRDGLIDCHISHVDLDAKPEYYALSYVWGDPEDTLPILVNGSERQVTRNLHAALSCFRVPDPDEDPSDIPISSLTPYNKTWWIDAVCIRQDDDEEKAREVLRMGKIFSLAAKVWVWLPLDDEEHLAASRKLFNVASGYEESFLTKWARTFILHSGEVPGSNEQSSVGQGNQAFPELLLNDRLGLTQYVEVLNLVLSHPWFTRIWTFQEAVLAGSRKNLVLDVGSATITMHDLHFIIGFFIIVIFPNQEKVPGLGGTMELWTRPNDLSFFMAWHSERGTQEDAVTPIDGDHATRATSLGRDLHNCLRVISERNSTKPHDKIYGILGLIENAWKLPPHLKPDYRTYFMVVYQRYARFIMEETGFLDIIHYTDPQATTRTSPSWVPNFLKSPPCTKMLDPSLPIARPGCRGHVQFSEDGNVLIVKGSLTDFIPADHARYSVSAISPRDESQLLEAWIEVFRKVFIPAAIRLEEDDASVPDRAVETFAHSVLDINLERRLCLNKPDVARALGRMILVATLKGPEYLSHALEALRRMPTWTSNLHTLWELLGERMLGNCLVSGRGKVVLLTFQPTDNAALADGDVICELKGALMPVILRPLGPPGHFTLVGSCDVVPGITRHMDDEYFGGKELTTFHIH